MTWGDQLVHYLDDEEARGFARRSPFGAAGVARPLTSEECWRGRGAQLPPDGNIFQTASRRESRRDDHTAAATAAAVASVSATVSVATSSQAPAPSTEKPLPSIASTTVKLEAESFRGGGGVSAGGGWIGVTGKVAPGARANSGGSTSSTSASSSRYGGGAMTDTTGDNRAAVTAAVHNPMWGSSGGNENVYAMNGSGNGLGGDSPGIGAAMPSPAASRLGTGGGGSGGGGLSFWEAKKGMEAHHQQATPSSLNHAGFYDDIGALGKKPYTRFFTFFPSDVMYGETCDNNTVVPAAVNHACSAHCASSLPMCVYACILRASGGLRSSCQDVVP